MHGSIDSGSTIIDLYIVTILATLLLVKRQCVIRKAPTVSIYSTANVLRCVGAECSVVDYMVAIEIGVYHTLGDANCLANH